MVDEISINVLKKIHTVNGQSTLSIDTTFECHKTSIIYGASGAGKTTILRMIAGLTDPDEGHIRVNGNVWFDSEQKINLPARKRSTGFVFQDYALFPNMTVLNNILFGLNKNTEKDKVAELLEDADLTNLQHQYPHKLSGGQQQRLALIRAIAIQPKLLLLDEPLSALDMDMRIKLQNLISSLKEKYDSTILLVSHDIPEIFKLADRVVEIKECRVSKIGTPQEIFDVDQLKKHFDVF